MYLLRIDKRKAGVSMRVLAVNLELYMCKMDDWRASAQDKRKGKNEKELLTGFSILQMS